MDNLSSHTIYNEVIDGMRAMDISIDIVPEWFSTQAVYKSQKFTIFEEI